MKKQILVATAAFALIAIMMVPATFAYIIPCTCEPGRTPGFWKHNIAVALGLSKGDYSSIYDSYKLNYDRIDWICEQAGWTLQEAYDRVSFTGGGAVGAAIRNGAAGALNEAAGLSNSWIV